MADVVFTGIVEPEQLVAHVQRRVGEQTDKITEASDTFRALSRQLEALAELRANAESETLADVAVALDAVAGQALRHAAGLTGIAGALNGLGQLRALGE